MAQKRKYPDIQSISGNIFGYWTVIGTEYTKDNHGAVQILCRCKCGTEKNVDVGSLRRGESKSCGCIKRRSDYDLDNVVGKVFGKLTVIGTEYVIDKESKARTVLCRCECGTEKYISIRNLIQGTIVSCGINCSAKLITPAELLGKRFGTWTVIGTEMTSNRTNGRHVLCKCDCGTERYLSVHKLTESRTRGCGICYKGQSARDMIGKKYGYWTVIGDEFVKGTKNNNKRILCRCQCGTEKIVSIASLENGSSTNCKCIRQLDDITGKRFGILTALYPFKKGKINYWHCKCDCGNEIDATYSKLPSKTSCGCLNSEHWMKSIHETQHFVNGTHIESIAYDKLRSNNTSGHTGVCYRSKINRYTAGIKFKSKQYYLGQFKRYEDAVKVRELAEDLIFRPTINYFELWSKRAEADPEWAKENPIRIIVDRKNIDEFKVSFSPNLLETE